MSDSVNKRLNVSDVFTTPYEANKSWGVPSSSFTNHGIFFEAGYFPTGSTYTHDNLVYESVLTNYYPEFYPTYSHSTSSYNQTNNYNLTLSTASYSKGILRLGNPATTEKYFPTLTSSFIYTINIPKSLYSERIQPTTFTMNVSGGLIYDDGEYNLRWSGSGVSSSLGTVISQSSHVGNLFYEQGLGVLTAIPKSMISTSIAPTPVNPTASYGWSVVWMSNPNGASPGSMNWEVSYVYVDNNNVSQSVNLSQNFGQPGALGAMIWERSGSGTFVTISGNPIKTNHTPHVDPSTPPADALFMFPPGSAMVYAISQHGSYAYYTNPYSVDPSLPQALADFTEVRGYAVFGHTSGDGIDYLGI